ncbi:MAG: hypothetical protein ACYC21_03980, partial [Eubacteriales bacterium]
MNERESTIDNRDSINADRTRLRYHIICFGCQMNERDTETLSGMLREMGYEPTGELEEADVIL